MLLGVPDQVLGVRWQRSRSLSAAITDIVKNRFPSSAGVAQRELKASAGIAGHRPLWIKLWVINPAGSQTHLPFSKPASSMPSALQHGVPTERG